MPTNLVIGKCHIPTEAASYTYSYTADSSYPLISLFGSHKGDWFQASTSNTGDHRFTFPSTGTNKAANFLYIGKANLLQAASVAEVRIKAWTSDDYAAGTSIFADSSFASATLYGPASEDYVTTFTTSSTYQYWYVNYNASAASKIPHSKLFFGSYIDPGREPVALTISRSRPSGARRRAAYTVSIEWEGIGYSTAIAMLEGLNKTRRYDPILLMTTTTHEILLSHRVLFGRVTDFSAPPTVTDYNSVSLTLEEIV